MYTYLVMILGSMAYYFFTGNLKEMDKINWALIVGLGAFVYIVKIDERLKKIEAYINDKEWEEIEKKRPMRDRVE